MDCVACCNLGFENWNEGFLDCSSADAFADLSTEKILGDTLGLELTCKPFNGEQRLVNPLEQNSISGDFASVEEIFPWTSGIGQLIRGQLDNAHVEQITHPSHPGTGSFFETNTFLISPESQQKGYSGCPPRLLEGSSSDKGFILPVKNTNASSANGKKRKKDQRKIFKGEGSDGKQITGKSPISNTCCKLEGTIVKESSNTTKNLKQDNVHAKTKYNQSINNHSRAERIRREKISERMKFLQDIVPGCSKITGKAAMLDEIINYVLSLQQQIDFLSRKVATLSSDVNLDNRQIPSRHANSNLIYHLQDGRTSMFGGPGGPNINSFCTIQDEFSHGTLLNTPNLNHLKVMLPQASMWNNDNPSG